MDSIGARRFAHAVSADRTAVSRAGPQAMSGACPQLAGARAGEQQGQLVDGFGDAALQTLGADLVAGEIGAGGVHADRQRQ